MTTLRIGELFAGYGGLGMGVQAALGGDVVWYSDVCKFNKDGSVGHYDPHRGACRIMGHRFPEIPNLGDVASVDWSQVEPVDVLTGGSPCQDLSHAGKRQGMTEGTRSNLWVAMREAIAQLRPSLVVWENVRGAYSAEAASGLVDDARLLADTRRRDGEPVLRALGRVLGDLSDLGYDASWHGLRAADVGAPHGRFRVFVVATDTRGQELVRQAGLREGEPRGLGGRRFGDQPDAHVDGQAALTLLPTPTTQDGANTGGASQFDRNSIPLNALVTLLPTPAVNDMGEGKTVEAWDEWTAKMKAEHGNGNGHGASLSIEAQRLLPTPTTTQRGEDGNRDARPDAGPNLHNAVANGQQWGQYEAAIRRWEALTRSAPPATELGPTGSLRLSAAFSEWMMGLPAGWVTDVPSITRNEALKALGNGVVPRQAAAALREMFAWSNRGVA